MIVCTGSVLLCRSVSHPVLSFDEKALKLSAGYNVSMDEVTPSSDIIHVPT